jgi:peptidoglycan lytic transglycosylase
LLAAPAALGQTFMCEDQFTGRDQLTTTLTARPLNPFDPLRDRLLRYSEIGERHRMRGLASYYSGFFDGRKTANGEIFRNRRYSAAHLTLPLGTWVEVKARATGKTLRLRVNDRGPYAKKFFLDLSRAAAQYLGVDVDPDRHVQIRIIALPGEKPLLEYEDIEVTQ